MSSSPTTLAAAAVLTAAVSTSASAAEYELDGVHSTVGFSVRHMMVANQRGQFNRVTGHLTWDEKDLSRCTARATIDLTSVDTREPKRDEHLRSADFFDVEKFPTMTFQSRKFERAGERLEIAGELTLHGVTRTVTLDAALISPESKDPFGKVKVGTSASTRLSRKAFGLTWNRALETGGIAVGDEIVVTLELEFDRVH